MKISRRSFALTSAAAQFILHSIGRAQSASPEAGEQVPAKERLAEMLGYLPGGILDGDLYIIWNDYQQQVATMQATLGDSAADLTYSEIAMRSNYAGIPQFMSYALMLEDIAGYPMDNIDQAIEFGLPPEACLVMRVKEIPETFESFLESVEYEEKANQFGTYWTIGEDGEMDLAHPVQRSMIARFNNIAILDENTIAYAPTSKLLETLQGVAAGDALSKTAELESLLVALPDDTTSTWILDGEYLMFEGLIGGEMQTAESLAQLEETFESSNEAAGSMPVVRTVCTGITAGAGIRVDFHDPESVEFLILETDAADMAQQAVDVVAWRVENLSSPMNGAPYSELIPNFEVEVAAPELVRCENVLAESPPRFSRMLISQDILPFAYRLGDE